MGSENSHDERIAASLFEAVETVKLLATAPECFTMNERAREHMAIVASFLTDPKGWPEVTVGRNSPPHSPIDRYRCVNEECPAPYSVWEFEPDNYDLDHSAVRCPACGAEGELFYRWFRGGWRG